LRELVKKTKSNIKEFREKNTELIELEEFYERVIKVIKRNNLKYFEVKPEFENLNLDKYSMDFVNFVIIIENYEFLVFIKNEELGFLNEKELIKFFKIFYKNPKKRGIIVIWNDDVLNSSFFTIDDDFKDYLKVIKWIRESSKPLEDLFFDLINFDRPKYDIIEFNLKKAKSSDIIDNFNNYLVELISLESERSLGGQKKEFLKSINEEALIKIKSLLEIYLDEEMKEKILEKKIFEILTPILN